MFIELHEARSSNGYSPNSISFSEIYAWSQLNEITLAPWELSVIRRLDATWLRVFNEDKK